MTDDWRAPHFTIIIPTKDRAEYLRHTLATCSMQSYDKLDIIVADDKSVDHTKAVTLDAANRDSRIRYFLNPAESGMRNNFEQALNQAAPGFVIALGGDDAILPNGIQGMADTINQTKLELLTWSAPVYIYPKVRSDHGQLILDRSSRDKIVSSKEYLLRQSRNLHYLSDKETPMFYVKGVVSTRLIQKVQARHPNGRFYQCATPDGYSGIVLAGEVKEFAFSAQPLAMHGVSPTSQGLSYLKSDEASRKTSSSFLSSNNTLPMHRDLASQPYSPLISLMTADYLLTAADLSGWPGPRPEIDIRNLLQCGLRELSHGLYGSDRLLRELEILLRIAKHHGLETYFRELVQKSSRKSSKPPFVGNGFSRHSIFMDGLAYGIRNTEDAAFAAFFFNRAYNEMNPASLLRTVGRSIRYFLRSRGSGGAFPDINNIS